MAACSYLQPEEHQRQGLHSHPECRATKTGDGSRHSQTSRNEELFQCENPSHHRYCDKMKRIESYANWPNHINATNEQLADAGFFFIGETDRVKCFYCNGGLQNWDENDNPLLEHAKWFPHCEYVLQKLGLEKVVKINSECPDLPRPPVPLQQVQHRSTAAAYQPESMKVTSKSRPSLSHQSDVVKQRDQAELISQAELFGFEKCAIKNLIERKHTESESGYDNLEQLIGDLQIDEENKKITKYQQPASLITNSAAQRVVPDGIEDSSTLGCLNLKEQLVSAMDETTCKICRERERSCVFISCGHMCCCYDCGKDTKQCPICKETIVEAIKIYKV